MFHTTTHIKLSLLSRKLRDPDLFEGVVIHGVTFGDYGFTLVPFVTFVEELFEICRPGTIELLSANEFLAANWDYASTRMFGEYSLAQCELDSCYVPETEWKILRDAVYEVMVRAKKEGVNLDLLYVDVEG